MLVLWFVFVGFLALSECQYQRNQYQNNRYTSRNDQGYEKDEYPPEPLTGYLNHNPKQQYGQQYGQQQYRQQQYGQQKQYYGPQTQQTNRQLQRNSYGYNAPKSNQQYQQRYNNYQSSGSSNNGYLRSAGKSFPNNNVQYYKPTAQTRTTGYTRQLQGGSNANKLYRQTYGQNSGQSSYGNNNQRGYNKNFNNQIRNRGYAQGTQTNGYSNGNSYNGQTNGYHSNRNGYSTGTNFVPAPQGRTLPYLGNGYQQGSNGNGFKSQPSFMQNGGDLTSPGNFFEDSFNEHNAGLGIHGFGQYKTLHEQEQHDYGSGGENKPLELDVMEKFAQTLPYDLDSVDGMGIL